MLTFLLGLSIAINIMFVVAIFIYSKIKTKNSNLFKGFGVEDIETFKDFYGKENKEKSIFNNTNFHI